MPTFRAFTVALFWLSFSAFGLAGADRGVVAAQGQNGPIEITADLTDAVNGKVFSRDALHAGLAASKGNGTPLQLTVVDEDVVMPVTLDYHDDDR